MKKGYILLLAILISFIFLFLFTRQKTKEYSELKIITYSLEGKQRKLLVADTEEKWQRGLMNYRSLPDLDGMMFIFPKKEYRTFWNENTYLDLDVYWLSDDIVVGKNQLPSIEKSQETIIIKSPEEVNKVIEIVTK